MITVTEPIYISRCYHCQSIMSYVGHKGTILFLFCLSCEIIWKLALPARHRLDYIPGWPE